MLPIVHGLETKWRGKVDFVYLDVAEAGTAAARTRLGFRATPHFFLLRTDGTVLRQIQGIVEGDSLDALLAELNGSAHLAPAR